MKIAVTCENNEVFQHFGHTPEFAVFETEGEKIVSETRLSSGETGHGALAGLLAEGGIELLICGGIGGGAINALTNAGIKVIGGATGPVRKVAEDYLSGNLIVREDYHCNHHHEGEHNCHDSDHSCGQHCQS